VRTIRKRKLKKWESPIGFCLMMLDPCPFPERKDCEKSDRDKEDCPLVRLKENREPRRNLKEKPRWDVLPWEQLKPVIRILNQGAERYNERYGEQHWKQTPEGRMVYMNKAIRHIVEYMTGVREDADSGEDPRAHAVCDLLFSMGFEE